jgi:hypothetical protein
MQFEACEDMHGALCKGEQATPQHVCLALNLQVEQKRDDFKACESMHVTLGDEEEAMLQHPHLAVTQQGGVQQDALSIEKPCASADAGVHVAPSFARSFCSIGKANSGRRLRTWHHDIVHIVRT